MVVKNGANFRSNALRTIRRTARLVPPELRANIPLPLKSLAWKLLNANAPVAGLDMRLWGGFSRSALAELQAMLESPRQPVSERGEAALALARWAAYSGDFAAARALILRWEEIDPAAANDPRRAFLEVYYLARLGEVDIAYDVLTGGGGGVLENTASYALMLATLQNPALGGRHASEAEALASINTVFRRHGISELAKLDADTPLSLDNLTGTRAARYHDPDNLVSIIVPAYNCEETIDTALRSLAAQSWTNIEVLVVDDASGDGTVARAQAFCDADSRFKLLRSAENGGSYVARNRGLAAATGRFVTVHDADDWAHPDRIAVQMPQVLQHQQPHTISQWVRCTTDLTFWGPWRPTNSLLSLNMGSHLFRRDLVEQHGGWDTARVSADSELIRRIAFITGKGRPRPFPPDCPLVFGRIAQTSLTQVQATHLATYYHGTRREYLESAELWHHRASGASEAGPPYFPAPTSISSERATPECDVLVVADWNRRPNVTPAWSALDALVKQGRSVAVFQYSHYASYRPRSLDLEVREQLWQRGVTIIAPGEKVAATNVVIADPAVFQHALDKFPEIRFEALFSLGHERTTVDDARLIAMRAHIHECFGTDPLPVDLPALLGALDRGSLPAKP